MNNTMSTPRYVHWLQWQCNLIDFMLFDNLILPAEVADPVRKVRERRNKT